MRRASSTASRERTSSTSRPSALLDEAGVPYEVDATMVRGLDYYTRTVFELHCDRLGAQSQVGGGGRYDGLIEQLGGPPTPAIGWALGVERLALALDEPERQPEVDVFIAADEGSRERALGLAIELRRAGSPRTSTWPAAPARAR